LGPQRRDPSSAQARAASEYSPLAAAETGCMSILPGIEAAIRAAIPASTSSRALPSAAPTSTRPSVTATSAPLSSELTVKTVPLTRATR
jgi:hypothetical protein